MNQPMKTIVIDTSLATGSVAAIDRDRIAGRTLPTAGEHARLLAAAIEAVAAELGWKTAAVELVAVVCGPGSFTGLRVGVTTAKALCWATGSRLVGVSSCEAIARGTASALGRHDAPVTVAFDAGRGEVFAARVVPTAHSPSGWSVEPGALAAAQTWLTDLSPGSIVSGPGLALLADALASRPDIVVAPPTAWMPAVTEIGHIATAPRRGGRGRRPRDTRARLHPPELRRRKAVTPVRGCPWTVFTRNMASCHFRLAGLRPLVLTQPSGPGAAVSYGMMHP
jgi:tRNA threonylcarbamoyladenosine biosynthesis protein TsaB